MIHIPILEIIRKMKLLLTILLSLTFYTGFGQVKNPWKGKPNSIEESFQFLDQMLDDTAKYTFATFPEDIATSRLHYGLGRWIRNNWGLWGSGKLKNELIDSGFVHPDDMSSILLKAYHRKLNDEPLNLSGDHKQHTTSEELLRYFPVGDTIVVNIYATQKKLFQKYASNVKGIAVIQSHNSEKLKVKLLSIEQKKKHKTKRVVGEEYEISPIYCNLIPPKGWTTN